MRYDTSLEYPDVYMNPSSTSVRRYKRAYTLALIFIVILAFLVIHVVVVVAHNITNCGQVFLSVPLQHVELSA